jgi:hypothetical protein
MNILDGNGSRSVHDDDRQLLRQRGDRRWQTALYSISMLACAVGIGSSRWFKLRSIPVRAPDGKITTVVWDGY